MHGLRWTLGVVTSLALAGFLALMFVAGGFRRSFGASETSPLLVALPFLAGVLIVLSLMLPERRMLLHAVAAIVVALMVGCVYLARKEPSTATVGLAYAVAWLWYYYRTMRPLGP
jgi:phosphatidylglycerophosphate synthase